VTNRYFTVNIYRNVIFWIIYPCQLIYNIKHTFRISVINTHTCFASCTPFVQGVSGSCKPCTSYDQDVCPSVCLSVRPSVRPSVTRWHCVKTTQARITKSSPTDSPRTLLFGIKHSSRNSKGFTPSEGVKWEWGRENSQFSANKSPYLRNGAMQDQSYY